MKMGTVILDNGAYHAKIGVSTESGPRLVPNAIMKAKSERRKQFIGSQIDDCKDLSGLYYILPFQKGYLINWDVQRQVWDYLFGKDTMNVSFEDTTIIMTEPCFNFSSIKEAMNEILFEEYQFKAIHRTNACSLSAFKKHQETPDELGCMVVDSGYSFTHIVPYHKTKKVKNGVRRINIGGKVLTNHLKEVISYRQLHVMDETYVINQVKENVCYVSNQFFKDMETAKLKGADNTIVRDYVLPDFSDIKKGYIKKEAFSKPADNEQIVRMNNERFAIPEVLFNPSDIGITEMGVSEAIIHSIDACPAAMRPHLYKNILLTGGNALFPGFRERVEADVRKMAPVEFDVKVTSPQNPVTYAWQGGKALSQSSNFSKEVITKKLYEEHGYSLCEDRFDV
ncbi:actin-related protein 6-like [Amphiura filiformis]|uniref:actin-related protein 6-like n=1 Tax=Amphiura filiformis TaxID=82378 RepID=UPI003B224CA5